MKAYLIREVNGVYDYAAVVFAETRNKAKAIGMNAGRFVMLGWIIWTLKQEEYLNLINTIVV